MNSPSGNPVFDYKAAFRRRAAFVQNLLALSGLLLMAVGFIRRFTTFEYAPPHSSLIGLALLASSLAWAYYWRAKLRHDFIRDHS